MRKTKINQRILILCEGQTEWIYANELKCSLPREIRNSISVEIEHTQGGNPKNLVEKAVIKKRAAIRERNRYNEIWVFFDNDNCQNLDKIFKNLEEENIKFAYTSLCIEHWFILHFERCGRAFQSGEEAQKHLKNIWKDYHKTNIRHYSYLLDKLDTAINNAEVLNKISEKNFNMTHEQNPYFTIPELIKKFKSLK